MYINVEGMSLSWGKKGWIAPSHMCFQDVVPNSRGSKTFKFEPDPPDCYKHLFAKGGG